MIKSVKDKQIIIDISRLIAIIQARKHPTGIDRVCLEYIKQYNVSAIAVFRIKNHYYFLKKKASKEIFTLILSWRRDNSSWQLVKFFTKLTFAINFRFQPTDEYMLNIGHSNIYINKKHSMIKLVFMLHDLIPFKYPEYSNFSNEEYETHKLKIDNAIEYADTIICNSQDTKYWLQHYANTLGKKIHAKTEVALLGCSFKEIEEQHPSRSLSHTEKNYFVALGTIEPRKNYIMLLNIWRKLLECATDKETIPSLIIIGRRGWRYENVANMLDNCLAIKGHVFELNNCNDADLQTYIKGAKALLLPSFAEGFGIPVIEALCSGTPAIISDLPVFHETAGNIPEYIDPLDSVSWMNMIMEYAKPNSIMRCKQEERIRSYKPPNWEQHFKFVDEILSKSASLNQLD